MINNDELQEAKKSLMKQFGDDGFTDKLSALCEPTLSDRILYKCGNCFAVSTIDQINEVTINECCMNRADRRRYVPIEKTSKHDNKWYRCPHCKQNIRLKGWEKI